MTTPAFESFRPYSCKICKKKFSQLSNLQFHQRVHSRSKPFTCKQCHASFRQQHLLQQHISSSHQGANTAPNSCRLCESSFNTGTALQSHLVKSHSAYFASRQSLSTSKEKLKLHRKALNRAHRQSLKNKDSESRRNGAIHDKTDQQNEGVDQVSSNGQDLSPDRTLLHLEIDPPPAITCATAPVKHQIICSPDSTTDAFGMAKDRIAVPSGVADSPGSMDEPKWYIGAPDGNMEEMKVYKDSSDQITVPNTMADDASQGTEDTDDIDIISSAPDSPACDISHREMRIEPSSTTSPDAPFVDQSPPGDLDESSIISIGSTPVASPACPTVGSSPAAILADDTSQPMTVEACDSDLGSPAHNNASPNAELLYGQCTDSEDEIVKQHIHLQNKRQSVSSSSDIDVETNLDSPKEESTFCNNNVVSSELMPKQESFTSALEDYPSPERARGLTVSPGKETVDTPVKVAEDVFSADDQDAVETGDDDSLSGSTSCMPRLELQSTSMDSPRGRNMRRQSSKDDMPVIDQEMPCIEKEFPVLERQTSISPDYRRCDMKEELTSSTDQESPNSTGTEVEPAPPDILPQYGPSIAPVCQPPQNSSLVKKSSRKKKAEVDADYFGDDDDQYTGSTEEEEVDECWGQTRSSLRLKSRSTSPEGSATSSKPKKTSVNRSDNSDRKIGFFDVFANFLQNKEQEICEDVKDEEDTEEGMSEPDEIEKKRGLRPLRKRPELESKPEYTSSEGEDLGEFRVETADPTVLKISRISPTSRPPVETKPTTTPSIPEEQTHMVASTNGTVVTLRRVSAGKGNLHPVHKPPNPESNPSDKNTGAVKSSSTVGIKEAAMDMYEFTTDDAKNAGTLNESQDANSGNYTLRKRKRVNFNLLAEGNLSDDDFIPDTPLIKKSKDFKESPHRKSGRARKKKPFDKAHFMNYNRRLLRLRKGICVLLETLFPDMVYPRRFNPETHSVDYLVDYITTIVNDKETAPKSISRCYGDIDWNVDVLICCSPKDCLRHLRRQLMKLLKALLPGLKVNRFFDHSSASVDALVEEISLVNSQPLSSQASHLSVPLPTDIPEGTPTATELSCVGAQNTDTGLPFTTTSATTTTQVSHSTKRKRREILEDNERLMPPPSVPSADWSDPATKKQRKQSSGKIDEPRPSTSSNTQSAVL